MLINLLHVLQYFTKSQCAACFTAQVVTCLPSVTCLSNVSGMLSCHPTLACATLSITNCHRAERKQHLAGNAVPITHSLFPDSSLLFFLFFFSNQYHAVWRKVKWSCVIHHKLLPKSTIVFLSASGGGLPAVSG